jgi:hypothetical protein
VAAALVCLAWNPGRANAGLVLTDAGKAQGFQLTTFADGFQPVGAIGPLGLAFPTRGGVLVSDDPGGVYSFPTTADGQHVSSATKVGDYGSVNAVGLFNASSGIYMTQRNTVAGNVTGSVVRLNPSTGSLQTIATGFPLVAGIVENPANGHLFVSTLQNGQIFDVNPATGAKTLFNTASLDGLSISADGKTLYGASWPTGHVYGYSTATGAQVFDATMNAIVDGIAVGTGSLAGNLFVNTNDGQLIEISLAGLPAIVIANQGSRGDFVAAEPDGSLLLTQSETVMHLIPPTGGGFGPTPSGGTPADTAPEPSTVALLALALVGLLSWRLRRRAA